MRLQTAAACLVLLALVAGCASPDPVPVEADSTAVAEPATEPQSASEDFGWTLQVAGRLIRAFDVDEGHELLTAEASWDCTNPVTCDLHAWLCSPEEVEALPPNPEQPDCGLHAVGTSPLSFEAEEPMEGEWALVFASDLPDVEVSGSIEFHAD